MIRETVEMRASLSRYRQLLQETETLRMEGHVAQVVGLTIEAEGISPRMGEICTIYPRGKGDAVLAEAVGFKSERTLLMPLGEMYGIQPGSVVVPSGHPFHVPAGHGLLGRVIDGLGRPIDGKGPLYSPIRAPLLSTPPHPLTRQRVDATIVTGVRVIDGLLTCGRGQRMGIFAGSGVGKSTIIGMLAKNTVSDITVIALIGERGREVRDFLERDLGEGLRRSVVVVSTSDQPALVRIRGAWVATAIAEYFRDAGLNVTFLMDSLTRFAMAQREVGLAVGEPPSAKGYTPSVFALLPKLLERAGTSDEGTITGFYTVLVEGDDLMEPISDAARSILDGHIVLSRTLASEGHYPAVDVLGSISRVMTQVVSPAHMAAAIKLRETLAVYQGAKDLIDIGAYVRGSNPQIDYAIDMRPRINDFLRQTPDDVSSFEETVARMQALFEPER